MTFVAEVREIFVLMIIQFHGTKVLGTFAPEERKFHGSECSMERKFLEPSLLRNESSTGAKVPRSECSMERKFHGSESSLYGLFAPGNESAEERKGLESVKQPWFTEVSRHFGTSPKVTRDSSVPVPKCPGTEVSVKLSREPSTNSQILLLTVPEPRHHSRSNGCSPIVGYPLQLNPSNKHKQVTVFVSSLPTVL